MPAVYCSLASLCATVPHIGKSTLLSISATKQHKGHDVDCTNLRGISLTLMGQNVKTILWSLVVGLFLFFFVRPWQTGKALLPDGT